MPIVEEEARVKQSGRNRSEFDMARAPRFLGAKKILFRFFFFSFSLHALPLLVFGPAFIPSLEGYYFPVHHNIQEPSSWVPERRRLLVKSARERLAMAWVT